jgi:hypothetical protein
MGTEESKVKHKDLEFIDFLADARKPVPLPIAAPKSAR